MVSTLMDLRITEIFPLDSRRIVARRTTVQFRAPDGLPDALRLVRFGIHFYGRNSNEF
ncbi:MAG: hypothetical protein WKF71_01105 [Pyrinomonadaceae bacterium]